MMILLGVSTLLLAGLASAAGRLNNTSRPVENDKVKDQFIPAPYDRQKIGGLLGERLRLNLEGNLVRVDEPGLLAELQNRPSKPPRISEYIGKFLHAASNTWAYTGDQRLKNTMDRLVRALIAAQLPDGYLAIANGDPRWTIEDVWGHKYVLIGLLSYYQVTGDRPALDAARKIGDLLTRTFSPGTIFRSGPELGLAAASVLEPACTLYRYTGEKRNLASHIVRAYHLPNGMGFLQPPVGALSLYKTANGTASDILSNLVGLLELHRLTGDESFLKPALAAWKDILAKRLYVTGTTSSGEYFKDDFVLPGEEGARVGYGCATWSWLQLNWQLLRLTGQPQYADELERTVYNQLLGAQDPRNGELSCFTPLIGRKKPAPITECCSSSALRGISMIPQLAWGTLQGGPAVLFYTPGEVTLPVQAADGAVEVGIKSETRFPLDGDVALSIEPSRPARFPVFLRVPSWCSRYTASVGGTVVSGQPGQFLRLERTWQRGERVEVRMDMTVQVLPGGRSYPGYVTIQRGPQVLALDRSLNPAVPFLHRAAPAALSALQLLDASRKLPAGWRGAQAYSIAGLVVGRSANGKQFVARKELTLVPFADARDYRVWLPRPDQLPLGPVALTAFGTESWSRDGNGDGSICDERSDTYRTTSQGSPAPEDWYAVEMDQPQIILRAVYRHGKLFPHGGWFDTSEGKPLIQIKRTREGSWETVAMLDSYPQTTSARPPNLYDGQAFEVKFKEPVRAAGIRIVGRPGQAFSSCAELAAYER
jgi:DUF1680 family protein